MELAAQKFGVQQLLLWIIADGHHPSPGGLELGLGEPVKLCLHPVHWVLLEFSLNLGRWLQLARGVPQMLSAL